MLIDFEQLVKLAIKEESKYRSAPANLSVEVEALCRVLTRKFAELECRLRPKDDWA